jgi:putative oxidoreductase
MIKALAGAAPDFGLLVLRVGTSATMFFAHGLPKLMNFGELSERFGDPFGLGSGVSLSMCIMAEFFSSIFLAIGFASRWAALLLVINMTVVVTWAHAGDPFQRKELGLIYLISFLALFFTGPGKYSVDHR